ncbi:hypothetical protein GPECTOR_9g722 [Gonium pectorale]|uniref:Uncharacterized protein n=1 Tax=Gonium pectorale TaxID=33097 RepID=A0A150GS48_GONPE|nr:hypothetical protein GPECTOR_9g722 [Gonium pectorale]|eukprot:KXZ52676.1 hypothetical protein GPECTOR_9g722 [Gonium pectorale]
MRSCRLDQRLPQELEKLQYGPAVVGTIAGLGPAEFRVLPSFAAIGSLPDFKKLRSVFDEVHSMLMGNFKPSEEHFATVAVGGKDVEGYWGKMGFRRLAAADSYAAHQVVAHSKPYGMGCPVWVIDLQQLRIAAAEAAEEPGADAEQSLVASSLAERLVQGAASRAALLCQQGYAAAAVDGSPLAQAPWAAGPGLRSPWPGFGAASSTTATESPEWPAPLGFAAAAHTTWGRGGGGGGAKRQRRRQPGRGAEAGPAEPVAEACVWAPGAGRVRSKGRRPAPVAALARVAAHLAAPPEAEPEPGSAPASPHRPPAAAAMATAAAAAMATAAAAAMATAAAATMATAAGVGSGSPVAGRAPAAAAVLSPGGKRRRPDASLSDGGSEGRGGPRPGGPFGLAAAHVAASRANAAAAAAAPALLPAAGVVTGAGAGAGAGVAVDSRAVVRAAASANAANGSRGPAVAATVDAPPVFGSRSPPPLSSPRSPGAPAQLQAPSSRAPLSLARDRGGGGAGGPQGLSLPAAAPTGISPATVAAAATAATAAQQRAGSAAAPACRAAAMGVGVSLGGTAVIGGAGDTAGLQPRSSGANGVGLGLAVGAMSSGTAGTPSCGPGAAAAAAPSGTRLMAQLPGNELLPMPALAQRDGGGAAGGVGSGGGKAQVAPAAGGCKRESVWWSVIQQAWAVARGQVRSLNAQLELLARLSSEDAAAGGGGGGGGDGAAAAPQHPQQAPEGQRQRMCRR